MAAREITSPERLAALRATGLLDTLPEASFDRYARLAARILGMPVAAISLVDDHRQFFKSVVGLPATAPRETPLSHSFCKHVVETRVPFVVGDARTDERVAGNPAIKLGVVAYAGAPLLSRSGEILGTLCVIGGEPREFSESDLATLSDLAAGIGSEIDLRAKSRALEESEARYKILVDNTENCAIVLFDRELRFLIADGKRVLGHVGLTRQQIVGRSLYEVAQPEALPQLERLYRDALAGKRTTVIVDRMARTFTLTTAPVVGIDGTIESGVAAIVDITEIRRTEAALQEKTDLLQSVLDHLTDSVLVIDLAAREIVANATAKSRLADGLPDTWEAPFGVFEMDDVTRVPSDGGPMAEALGGRAVREKELIFRRPSDDRPKVLSITAGPLRSADGVQRGAILVARDITEAKRAERVLEEERSYVRLLSHVTSEVLLAPNVESAMRVCLRELCLHTGWVAGHVLSFREDEGLLVSENIWHGGGPQLRAIAEANLARGEGVAGKALVSGVAEIGNASDEPPMSRRPALHDAGIASCFAFSVTVGASVVSVLEFFSTSPTPADARLVHVITSVSTVLARVIERERHAAELASLSLTDELTGLNNRRGFLTLGEQARRAAQRTRREFPLFFIDLDGLKRINDTLGHKAGDRAIIETANVLRTTFRDSDIVARLGGDEFVALATDAQIEPVRQRLAQNVASFNALPNRDFQLAMSVGVTVYDPQKTESIDELLARADADMYEKKRQRRGVRSERPRPSTPRPDPERGLSYDALVRLQAITSTLAGPSSQSEIASVALRECLGLLGARAAAFRLVDERGDLVLLASAGYGERGASPVIRADSHLPVTNAMRARMPIFLGSHAAIADDYPGLSDLPAMASDGAWAALPLIDGNRSVGVLALSFAGPRAFASDDRAFLMAAASQFAAALGRADDSRRVNSSKRP